MYGDNGNRTQNPSEYYAIVLDATAVRLLANDII